MGSDALLVGVEKSNPTNAATSDSSAEDQTKSSAFLTVQSFTNFAAATGAITTAWQSLQVLSPDRFDAKIWPFALSLAWLLFALVSSAQAGAASSNKASFWVSGLFLGFLNALTLFAAVVGVSTAVPGT